MLKTSSLTTIMAAYLKDDFSFDFGLFLSKISMINSKISSMIEKFSKTFEEVEEESTEDIEIIEDLGTVQIPDDLANVLFDLSENLKNQVFYNSVSISIYSFLEFSMIEYCRLIDNYIVGGKPFKEYRNQGLEKAKEYLKDNFEIDFGTIANWDDISKFQKIRNLIVHNDANIYKDYDNPLEEQPDYPVLSQMSESINITSSGTFFIKSFEYINTTLTQSEEMIESIISRTKDEVKKKVEPKDIPD